MTMARVDPTPTIPCAICFAVSLTALLLAACGGAARDADGAPRDDQDRVPGAFVFPEGGVEIDGPVGLSNVPYTIDRTGAFWYVGCAGLYVIHDGQVRFYDSTNSAVPESMTFVHADALNRIWVSGGVGTNANTLSVFEQGRFRPVLTSPALLDVTSSANGVVWSSTVDSKNRTLVVRQVAPTLGEPLPMPTSDAHGFSTVTDRDGALWLTRQGRRNDTTAYRWADGVWTDPVVIESTGLQYVAEQDVLWTYGDAAAREVRRVRWNGVQIEQISKRGIEDARAVFIGFGAGGRQLWADDDELLEAEDGAVLERHPLPSDAGGVRLSWDSAVYVFTPSALYRQLGDERTHVLDLERFGGTCP
jgi:hypothetical protein